MIIPLVIEGDCSLRGASHFGLGTACDQYVVFCLLRWLFQVRILFFSASVAFRDDLPYVCLHRPRFQCRLPHQPKQA